MVPHTSAGAFTIDLSLGLLYRGDPMTLIADIDGSAVRVYENGAAALVICLPSDRLFQPLAITFDDGGNEIERLTMDPAWNGELPTVDLETNHPRFAWSGENGKPPTTVELKVDDGVHLRLTPEARGRLVVLRSKTFKAAVRPSGLDDGRRIVDMDIGECVDENRLFVPGRENLPPFSPLRSFALTNRGTATVTLSDLRVNGRGFWTLDSILSAVVGSTPEELAFAAWDIARRVIRLGRTYQHLTPGPATGFSVTRFLNGYGSGACGTINRVFALLSAHLGVAAETGSLADGSHAVTRLNYGGSDRYFDAHYGSDPEGLGLNGAFFRNDSGEIAGYDELAADANLIYRAGRLTIGRLAALIGNNDSFSTEVWGSYEDPSDIVLTLHPGESITYRRDDSFHRSAGERTEGIGIGTFRVNIASRASMTHANMDGRRLHFDKSDDSGRGAVEIEVDIPYPLVGLSLAGTVDAGTVELSIADTPLWRSYSRGQFRAEHSLPPPARTADGGTGSSRLSLRLTGTSSTTVELTNLELYFQANLRALPSLVTGENQISLSVEPAADSELEVRLRSIETSPAPPPVAPKPLYPCGDDVADTCEIAFVPGDTTLIREWEVVISADPECRYSYLPKYHRFIEESPVGGSGDTRRVEFDGESPFQSGARYFWRVRGCSRSGVWGDWSNVASFRWVAPPMATSPAIRLEGRAPILHWNAPGDGDYTYEVYGSNVQGFQPRRTEHSVWVRRTDDPAVAAIYGSTLLAETRSTELDLGVFSEEEAIPVHYRIVVRDEMGRRSVSTPACSLSCPYIFTSEIEGVATVGVPYSSHLRVAASLGPMGFNRLPERPRYTGYHDKQVVSFRLVDGPQWLSIRDYDGHLSGVPGPGDRGIHSVLIEASDQFGETDSVRVSIEVH